MRLKIPENSFIAESIRKNKRATSGTLPDVALLLVIS
nr:MAG TPA: nonstructural protein [Caudoviricetes sp.]